MGALWKISEKVDNAVSKVDTLSERVEMLEQLEPWQNLNNDVILEPWFRLQKTNQEKEESSYSKKTVYKITSSLSGRKPGRIDFYDMKDSSWINWNPIFNKTNQGGQLKDMLVTDKVFEKEADAIRWLNAKDPNWEKNNSWGYITTVLYVS